VGVGVGVGRWVLACMLFGIHTHTHTPQNTHTHTPRSRSIFIAAFLTDETKLNFLLNKPTQRGRSIFISAVLLLERCRPIKFTSRAKAPSRPLWSRPLGAFQSCGRSWRGRQPGAYNHVRYPIYYHRNTEEHRNTDVRPRERRGGGSWGGRGRGP